MMISIVGAEGEISNIEEFMDIIKMFSDRYNIVIQVFDADMIYSRNHILSSVLHALRAMEQNTNTTNSLSMEILLYASGERQLKHAIPKIGIKKGCSRIVLLALDISDKISDFSKITSDILDSLHLSRNDSVLNGDLETLIRFGVKQTEIDTIMKHKYEDIILEKIALVDIIK